MLYFTLIKIIHLQDLEHSLSEMTPIKIEESPKVKLNIILNSKRGLHGPLFFAIEGKRKGLQNFKELDNML